MTGCDCRKGARCEACIEADGLTRPTGARTVRVHVPSWPNILPRSGGAGVIHLEGASNDRGEEEA